MRSQRRMSLLTFVFSGLTVSGMDDYLNNNKTEGQETSLKLRIRTGSAR